MRTNTQPTEQPPKYRAIQIYFVGLGGQGISEVWQKKQIFLMIILLQGKLES